uniref:uncharacterized protein n=1 Tax=Pristiophorus japonicus TaxID=55135 RepID=UPI00398F3FC7
MGKVRGSWEDFIPPQTAVPRVPKEQRPPSRRRKKPFIGSLNPHTGEQTLEEQALKSTDVRQIGEAHAPRKSGGGRGYGGSRDGSGGGGDYGNGRRGGYGGRGGGRHNSGERNSYSGSQSGGDGSSYGKYGGHRDYD